MPVFVSLVNAMLGALAEPFSKVLASVIVPPAARRNARHFQFPEPSDTASKHGAWRSVTSWFTCTRTPDAPGPT